jgi:hypothetical protein
MTDPTPDPRVTIAKRCALELRDGEGQSASGFQR